MTHPIDLVLAGDSQTLGSEYWVRFDEAFMEFCSRIVVLKIDGWDSSRGVKREIEWFRNHERAIDYLEWSVVEAEAERDRTQPNPHG